MAVGSFSSCAPCWSSTLTSQHARTRTHTPQNSPPASLLSPPQPGSISVRLLAPLETRARTRTKCAHDGRKHVDPLHLFV